MVKNRGADVLATQAARASATMILIILNRDNSVAACEGLAPHDTCIINKYWSECQWRFAEIIQIVQVTTREIGKWQSALYTGGHTKIIFTRYIIFDNALCMT